MKNRSILFLILWTLGGASVSLNGQIAYGIYGNYFTAMDLSDCSLCQLFQTPAGGDDVTVLPDGRIIFINEMLGLVYNAQGNILNSFNCPHEIHSNCLHNGVLYLGTSGGLYTVNLTNYLVTFIGGWAPGMHDLHGLYSLNGSLYSTNLSNSGGRPIWLVNIANPTQSTFVQNMPAGTYTVREILPPGATSTTPPKPIVIKADSKITGILVGEAPPATPPVIKTSIEGRVFTDTNRDGKLNDPEQGLGNRGIQLVDSSNKVIATVQSKPDGSFRFENMPVGTYTVREILPPGTVSTTPPKPIVIANNSKIAGILVGEAPLAQPQSNTASSNSLTLQGSLLNSLLS
jgi:hypothetical protein